MQIKLMAIVLGIVATILIVSVVVIKINFFNPVLKSVDDSFTAEVTSN